MAPLTVKFSNTGNISGGYLLLVKEKTYVVTSVNANIVTDLAGARTRLSGVESGKRKWNFVAVVKRTPDSGYAPLGDPSTVGQSLFKWAHPSTAAEGLLKFQNIDGATIDVLWKSTWQRPTGITNDINGATVELYEIPVEVWEM